jgi:murein DD-endopeptidase MepM/ murein hydrolase activator NlpD
MIRLRKWYTLSGAAVLLLLAGVVITNWNAEKPAPDPGPSAERLVRGPMGPPIPPQFQVERTEDRFPAQSTLRDLLAPRGFSPQDIHQLITDTRGDYDLNRVQAGHRYAFECFGDGRFKQFEYDIDESRYLTVWRDDDGYESEIRERVFDTQTVQISGRIKDSFWNALIAEGESGQLVMSIHELLQWDVDFTAIQPDDSFKAIFEKSYYQGEFVKYGEIHALEFTHGGRAFFAFKFDDPKTGKARYYDQDGKGVKKAFLKVPFKYDYRISSGFSYSRLHPVLGKKRPHYGIDYAAPTGTPVLASAAGRVVSAGWNGGSGKMVKLRHPNGYYTFYLHLSKILVKAGTSVAQGDRIGLVGSTGLATGPHLDYRIQDRQGRFLNPKKYVALPSETGLPDELMKEFIAVRDAYMRQLEEIPSREIVPRGVAVAG